MSEFAPDAKTVLVRQLLLFAFLGPLCACIIFGIGAELVLPQVGTEKYVPLFIGIMTSLPAGVLFMLCAMFAVKFVIKRAIDPSRWRVMVCTITYVSGVLVMAACYLILKIDGAQADTDFAALFGSYVSYTLMGALIFAPVFLLAGPVFLRNRIVKRAS